jgi:ribosome-binding protein aMBF1 (putative translation factor)
MRGRKVEVLEVPVLASHIETMRQIAERRMISVDRLASEMIAKEIQLQRKLFIAFDRKGPPSGSNPKSKVEPSKRTPKTAKPKDSLLKRIGVQIRKKRLKMEMSQYELSQKAGFSRAFIVDIESGNRSMGLDNLYHLASILEMEGSELVHLAEHGSEELSVED